MRRKRFLLSLFLKIKNYTSLVNKLFKYSFFSKKVLNKNFLFSLLVFLLFLVFLCHFPTKTFCVIYNIFYIYHQQNLAQNFPQKYPIFSLSQIFSFLERIFYTLLISSIFFSFVLFCSSQFQIAKISQKTIPKTVLKIELIHLPI